MTHKSAPIRFGSLRATPPLATAGMRIGLLGGSFNPPHAGHRLISQIALRRLGLDRVWWIVTPGNPLKSRSELLPLAERLGLANAIKQDARITVTSFETGLASPFTAGTLAFLRLRYPSVRFVWLMGADCLAEFHRWRQWRDIFRLLPVAVVDRPGWHLRSLASPAARSFGRKRLTESRAHRLPFMPAPAWTLLTGPLSPLSSTVIRAGTPAPHR